jgi:TRAP-type C4-dicarboxylate transport system permease small subunit
MINYCTNITCFNQGVCQPSFLNFTCLCLGESYSGQYCEITANKIIVRKRVSRSFAYIAIIAMLSVLMFIAVLDVLKYFFGIDPVTRRIKQKKKKKKQLTKKKISIPVRLVYVNKPSI